MDWTKALITGVVGGVVLTAYNFFMHGVIMANAYTKHTLFRQDQANPLWFLLVAVMLGIFGALLFAKTRDSWAAGLKGGLTFGFWLGMVAFFFQFYSPLIYEGFPYHLSWCWGGINLIGWMVFGAVAGMIPFNSAEDRAEP
jgi:hypothetical protein